MSKGKEVNKGGRPRKDLTDAQWEDLIGMMEICCTQAECCHIFGMDDDTLDRNIKARGELGFSHMYKKHSAKGKRSLRRSQFLLAQEGNPTMLIWLGKQWLDQKDKQEMDLTSQGQPLSLNVDFDRPTNG